MPLIIVLFYLLVLFPTFYLAVVRLARATPADAIDPVSQFSSTERGRAIPGWAVTLIALGVMTLVLSIIVFLVESWPDFTKALDHWGTVLVLGASLGGVFSPRTSWTRLALGHVAAYALIEGIHAWTNWLTLDMLGFAVCGIGTLLFRQIPMRFLSYGSVGMMLYDVINVFGTKLMIRAIPDPSNATSMPASLAGAFTIPMSLSLSSDVSISLGYGDIMIPGLWVMAAARTTDRPMRAVLWTIAGISVAHVVTLAVLLVSQVPLPALLFLLPGAAAGYWIGIRPPRTR